MEWKISDNDLETLKECIEYANGTEKDFMIEICSIYQVLLARWRPDLINNYDSFYPKNTILAKEYQRSLAITKWCTIFAYSNSLFDYARRSPSHLNKNIVKETVISKIKNPWKLDEITMIKSLPYNNDYIDCIEKGNKGVEFVNL